MTDAHDDLAGCRVLVVEDEAHIAMLVEDTLEAMGCQVVGMASRLAAALEQAASLDFDVALLDINLDGEASYPAAEAIAARGLAFVFATGYGAKDIPESLRGAPVLQKPYRRHDLERALQRALKQAPPAWRALQA